jgi:hypothetical protein
MTTDLVFATSADVCQNPTFPTLSNHPLREHVELAFVTGAPVCQTPAYLMSANLSEFLSIFRVPRRPSFPSQLQSLVLQSCLTLTGSLTWKR